MIQDVLIEVGIIGDSRCTDVIGDPKYFDGNVGYWWSICPDEIEIKYVLMEIEVIGDQEFWWNWNSKCPDESVGY